MVMCVRGFDSPLGGGSTHRLLASGGGESGRAGDQAPVTPLRVKRVFTNYATVTILKRKPAFAIISYIIQPYVGFPHRWVNSDIIRRHETSIIIDKTKLREILMVQYL